MPTHRRPRAAITVLATLALGWSALVGGTASAAAPAVSSAPASAPRDAPHDPATYYAGTDGLTGAALEARLHTIISNNTQLTYDQVFDDLPYTDADPNSSGSLIDFYSGTSLLDSAICNHGGSCAGQWNREHTWAKSHGDFGTVTGPGTDLFHMRPELADVNSTRNNLDFDDGGTASVTNCAACKKDSDSFEPRAAIKGDVARGLFYMATRYDGGDGFPDLVLNDYTCNAGSKAPNIGKLSTLVKWSLADPPDATEKARNDLIDGTYQHNRNPFIDHPEWVTSIWGDGVGQGPACGTTSTGGGGTTTPPTDPGTPPGTGTAPSNLVISEAYVNGGSSGATYKNKFVELYNPLTSTVDLSQYSLQYRSATGTGAASGRYDFVAGAQIAAQSYFVVQLPSNGSVGAALPQVDANAASSNVNPATAGGTLYLAGTHTSVTPTDDSVGDTIGWGTSNAPETKAASGNSVTKSYQRNATNSDTDDNSVDFTAATPSPGAGLGGNHAPTTSAMTASTPEDTPATVTLAASDADNDALTWTITQAPTQGSASVSGSTLTYTPAPDYNGADTVGVTVSDGHGGTAVTTVSITVTAVDDAPVAQSLSVTTARGTATQVQLAATDVDDTDLTYAIATQPAHGSVTLAGSVATYTPSAGYFGPDSFTYTARDPAGATSAPATVAVTVTNNQQVPTATSVVASTAEDTPVTFTLPASDPNDDPLTYAVATPPSHGTVSVTGNQATYTPSANFNGDDAFTFTASDPTSTSTAATAALTVTPVNDAPTADDLTAGTLEDGGVTIPLSGADVDGDPLTFAAGASPAHGTVSVAGATATYTPAPGFSGTDAFTYTASDGQLSSAPATVVVTVTPINHVPSVAATQLQTTAGSAVTTTLETSDPDGDPVTITDGGAPQHGAVTFSGRTLTYTPSVRSGSDSFLVTVSDGHGGTATAQVAVDVVARTAGLSVTSPTVTRGTRASITIAAADAGPGSGGAVVPTGSVEVRTGDIPVATPTLGPDGTAVVTGVPSRAGTFTVVATYAGDDLHDPVTASSTWTVKRSGSTMSITSSGPLRRGKAGTIKVAVRTVTGIKATGRTTLTFASRTFTTKLSQGVATFRIGRLPTTGKVAVTARYAGDAQYAPGTGRHTFTVKK